MVMGGSTNAIIHVVAMARRAGLPMAELAHRRAAWKPPAPRHLRGYGALYSQHVGQADEGCDFDFLSDAGTIREPEIH